MVLGIVGRDRRSRRLSNGRTAGRRRNNREESEAADRQVPRQSVVEDQDGNRAGAVVADEVQEGGRGAADHVGGGDVAAGEEAIPMHQPPRMAADVGEHPLQIRLLDPEAVPLHRGRRPRRGGRSIRRRTSSDESELHVGVDERVVGDETRDVRILSFADAEHRLGGLHLVQAVSPELDPLLAGAAGDIDVPLSSESDRDRRGPHEADHKRDLAAGTLSTSTP